MGDAVVLHAVFVVAAAAGDIAAAQFGAAVVGDVVLVDGIVDIDVVVAT